ncbi:PaaI family thioesterase [Psychromonas sp. psych-6C06]|uniref:PaaI family thioesterase n=1 Tax=Psychromonas sp. psych-6C06 TaxID=2058089 RepID=UPI000C333A01|nr:PaaI family thioesterase [Psychromonas sp. psych-6C06]PKF61658.1 PaaI family thioesterase [Psychromonas sp. psych-6C06]
MTVVESINTKVMTLKNERKLPNLQLLNKQSSHQHCMLCGTHPPLGLKLDFYHNDNEVWTIAKGSIHQQGYQGILHGGFLCALLDAAMCQAIFAKNAQAVTADMSVRFLHEVATDSEILVQGMVISNYTSLYKVKAALYVENKLMATAEARFMKKKVKK